jgi:hypothetical protein
MARAGADLATVGECEDCVVELRVRRHRHRLAQARCGNQNDALGTSGGKEELPPEVHVLPAAGVGRHGADGEYLQKGCMHAGQRVFAR